MQFTLWHSVRNILACLVLTGVSITSAAAEDVLLTVTNPRISGTAGEITFTRRQLGEVEWRTIETETEFTDGKKVFVGPRIEAVLDLIGHAGAETVRLVAANDYAVDVEIAEIIQYDAIIAMEMNGKQLSIRDKGPLWVMYPLDDHDELQDPAYNSRLIWQLTKMILK